MFEKISETLERTFKRLRDRGKISEQDLDKALREIRLCLLEADVNFKVVKDFVNSVKKRAIEEEVLESLTPGQHVVKIVKEEMIKLLGEKPTPLEIKGKIPVPIMLVGLQGSGKTTTAGKLSLMLKKKGRRPALVSTDVRRPAAIEQLEKIAKDIDVPYVGEKGEKSATKMAKDAIVKAQILGCDVLIVDTAGRLQIEEELMEELSLLKDELKPSEILFVVDAMGGQEMLNVALGFDKYLDFTGIVLTKLDGDARGGVALSTVAVTKKPIKFVGIGESLDAFSPFYPDRIASRILGMGDVLSLIEKVQKSYDEKRVKELEEKFRKSTFTLDDFKTQIGMIKKMGSLESILELIPGFSKFKDKVGDFSYQEKELKKIEAIINSMTKEERLKPQIIDASRKRRIARGSGTTVQDVNRLLKNFKETKKIMKKMSKNRRAFRSLFPF